MTARKPPRTPEQRLARWSRSMVNGTIGGRVASASLLAPSASQLAAVVRTRPGAPGVGGSMWQQDDLTSQVTGTPPPTAYTLTFEPIAYSEAVKINGLTQRPGTDYTISGTTLTMSSGLLTAGDEFFVDYEYLAQTPIAPTYGWVGAVSADNPAAWWRLDETSGTSFADHTGNGHTATLNTTTGVTYAAAGLITGDSDTALGLAGGGYRLLPGSSSVWDSPTWTIEAVIKVTGTPNMGFFTRFDNSYTAKTYVLDKIGTAARAEVYDSTGTAHAASGGTINDGTPHHVVATFDGSTLLLYVDGTQVASTAFTGTYPTSGGQPPAIAGNHDGTYAMTGTLDDTLFYTSALSAARVLAHAQAGGFA